MQKWSFKGVDLCTKAWYVENVDGLGPPGFRGEDLTLPYRYGTKYIKKKYNSKSIILNMWVAGVDRYTGYLENGKTTLETLYENIDYLNRVFGSLGRHTLRRTLPNGEVREAKAEVYDKFDFGVRPEGYSRFSVEFELSDPFFYDLNAGYIHIPVSGTTVETIVSVTGTAPASSLDITLVGSLTNTKITNLNNNVSLSYNGVIGAGESVLINTRSFSCSKNGVNDISSISHDGDSYWFLLEPGENNLVVESEFANGTIAINYKPTYF